ncbi:hypothetical protein [Sphaerisporangium corydalis]|uniref:ATP-grasp domain-containing protein n=1 Tax=Sphaerisporangium corydalis TaxID=1441875 RepID=A0ABV9E9P9_9ACTN|nr:hypothetical protein [Sphaerisporangium corydalis]
MNVLVMNRAPLSTRPYPRWIGPEHQVVLLSDATAARGASSQARAGYAHVSLMDPFHDSPLVENEVMRLHAEYGFDRIVTTSEFDLLRAARLRESLGVHGQGVAAATAYRDKIRMKELLGAAGIPVVPFAAAPDLTSLAGFVRDHGYPVVVKPRRGGASIGVEVLRGEADLLGYAGRAPGLGEDHGAPLMVERYLGHQMAHVDGIVIGGEPALIWPSTQGDTSCLGVLSGEPLRSVMLDRDDPLRAPLCDLTRRALAALPTEPVSLFHAEIFVTPGGGLVLNEIACRLGGGRIEEAVELGFGVSLAEVYVRAVAGRSLPPLPAAPARIAGLALFPPRPGTVVRIPRACPVDGVQGYRLGVAEGDVLGPAALSIDEMGSLLVSGHTRREAEGVLAEATDWFIRETILEPGPTRPGVVLAHTTSNRT